MRETLQILRQNGVLSHFDLQFADFIEKLNGEDCEKLLLATVLTSHATAQGHVCLALSDYAAQFYPPLDVRDEGLPQLQCPSLSAWLTTLQQSKVVGSAEQSHAPLILIGQLLYLQRYWAYEQQLARQIWQRLQIPAIDLNTALQSALQRLFPNPDDRQRLAAETALQRAFCIISGGPGTGKTSTVVKILTLLLEQNPQLHIALAAPTGKAAARLQESIRAAKPNLDCAEHIRESIPETAYTLHRLLGSRQQSTHFKHHQDNPLSFDVVVVDEASMVDLALMSKLADALKPAARWILLGDKDQLASVESGSVLGDLCRAQQVDSAPKPLRESIVLLDKSYRFNEHSLIGQLARAVQAGRSNKVLRILDRQADIELDWQSQVTVEHLPTLLKPLVTQFALLAQADNAADALQLLGQQRILTALRQGYFGVENLNRLIEQQLGQHTRQRWYHARPIMITRNDYNLHLFNGDIGIIWQAGRNAEPLACFPDHDGGIRSFVPNRLPAHETVYAMTIHKSQGSEFERVVLVLPDQDTRLLSRELFYTGITRSKSQLAIWARSEVVQWAVERRIQRHSGLLEALLGWQEETT